MIILSNTPFRVCVSFMSVIAKCFVAGQVEALPNKRAKRCPASAWTFKARKEAGLFNAILFIYMNAFYKYNIK